MPRRVKPREGKYERDVASIQRIVTAVREDSTLPETVKSGVITDLQHAVKTLIDWSVVRETNDYPGRRRTQPGK